MADQNNEAADKVVGELKHNFTVVGKHRIHAWYAWAAVGILIGALVAIAYVANRSGQVELSAANESKCPVMPAPNPYTYHGEGSDTFTFSAGSSPSWDDFNFATGYDGTNSGSAGSQAALQRIEKIEAKINSMKETAVKRCGEDLKVKRDTGEAKITQDAQVCAAHATCQFAFTSPANVSTNACEDPPSKTITEIKTKTKNADGTETETLVGVTLTYTSKSSDETFTDSCDLKATTPSTFLPPDPLNQNPMNQDEPALFHPDPQQRPPFSAPLP